MKPSLIVTICFFLLLHTSDFWGPSVGPFFLLIMLIFLGAFLFVLGFFLVHIYYSIREKFQSKAQNISLLITSLVIGITIYAPLGILKYETFTADNILVAGREGAANCHTVVRLKKDGSFTETSFCFGPSRTTGTFKMKNDTIWFSSSDMFYEFGIIGPSLVDSSRVYLNLHRNEKDKMPNFLLIQK